MTVAAETLDQLAIDTIRTLSIDGVQKANSGHPGAPMGAAPMAYVAVDALPAPRPDATRSGPTATGSCCRAGHASMLLYSLLHLTGYDLTLDDLERFRQWGSADAGPPRVRPDAGRRGDDRTARPGLRQRRRHGHRRAAAGGRVQPARPRRSSTTGPTASARTATSRRASRPRRPAWPATSGSASSSSSTTTTTSSSTGRPSMAWAEDVLARFDAYGWHTQRVEDGNDLAAIAAAIERRAGRPAASRSSPCGRTSASAARTSRTARRPTARRSAPTRSA